MADSAVNGSDSAAIDPWAALDGLPDYLAILDPHGVIRYINAAWQQLLAERPNGAEAFGVGKDYIAGYRAMVDLEHDDGVALSKGLRAVLAGASDHFDLNYPYQVAGERHWFTIRVVPYAIEGARGALVQQRDISGRKRAEAALRESEELFRQIAENIGEVFWMTDLHKNRMLYISPAYEQIWGRTCESLYAHPASLIEAIHPEDRPRVSAALARQAQGAYDEEYRVVQPDGSIRWVQDRAFPIRDASGAIYRIAGIAADITERRQAEMAVRQSIQQEEIIRAQAAALAELSTPLIPITDDVMVMPLVGSIDSRRAEQVIETLLSGIAASKARIAILDITGVVVVDTQVANALIRAAQAVKLLGAQVVLTGIRPEVAQTLIGLGADLGSIVTRSTLQSGIASVIGRA